MLSNLIELLKSAAPAYTVTLEEQKMMNVVADGLHKDSRFIYVEEYRTGYYTDAFNPTRVDKVNIYFCRFCEMHDTAAHREKIRKEIEQEAVIPFIRKALQGVDITANYEISLPHFDANEVSIRLSLTYRTAFC